MKIKVCGMREPGNISEAGKLRPDFMGFIFHPGSPRYAGNMDAEAVLNLPTGIARVGVFVNENPEIVLQRVKRYALDFVQLHGSESVSYCRLISRYAKVIKTFPVSENTCWDNVNTYAHSSAYFLFDTASSKYGGSGKVFDWKLLGDYTGETPFLLAGGIQPGHKQALLHLNHPRFYGVDINSGFETEPGIKNIELLKRFI